MSKVTELVNEEAERAEAESPDEDTAEAEEEESQEVEPQTQPDAAPTGEPTPDDIKAFQSEHARHERALMKLMGDDFGMLVVCDDCGGMGYRPPAQLKTHKKFIGCETCNGFGQVLTGSKAAGNETQPCPVCAGRGFLEEMPPAPAGQPTANGEQQQQPQYGTPGWMGNPDLSAQPAYQAPVG